MNEWNNRADHSGEANKMVSNADRIRSMGDEELARCNVRGTYESGVDYGYDGEPYESWTYVFETSDGSHFYTEDDAIEHELDWLRQPAKEETE